MFLFSPKVQKRYCILVCLGYYIQNETYAPAHFVTRASTDGAVFSPPGVPTERRRSGGELLCRENSQENYVEAGSYAAGPVGYAAASPSTRRSD